MTLVVAEDNSAGEDYFLPLKRFQTCNSQWQYESSLLDDMLSYILKQFHRFIPDAELEDNILKYNPIPSNAPPPAPLDVFLRKVLEENHKYLEMQQEKFLQKIQQMYFADFKDWKLCSVSNWRAKINFHEFEWLTEQSIMMLGQVFIIVTYNRRLSVLNASMK